MIVGRPLACEDEETDAEMGLREVVLAVSRHDAFPILYNVDLGHADPKLTLPIGAVAEVSLSHSGCSFAVVEACVEGP